MKSGETLQLDAIAVHDRARSRSYDPGLGQWISRDPIGYADGLNEYNYVKNNPTTTRDQAGLYDIAGHFYTTYLVAIAAGLNPKDAAELAYYSQRPDQKSYASDDSHPSYDAIDAFWGSFWFESGYDRKIQSVLHSLHGGSPGPRRECLIKLLKSEHLSNMDRGLIIHALADSFAHTHMVQTQYVPFDASNIGLQTPGFTEQAFDAPFGHFDRSMPDNGHEWDNISYNDFTRQKYFNYTINLYVALGAGENPSLRADVLGDLIAATHGLKTGSTSAQETELLHNLAVKYDYSGTLLGADPARGYFPERQEFPFVARMKDPTKADVDRVLALICKHCSIK